MKELGPVPCFCACSSLLFQTCAASNDVWQLVLGFVSWQQRRHTITRLDFKERVSALTFNDPHFWQTSRGPRALHVSDANKMRLQLASLATSTCLAELSTRAAPQRIHGADRGPRRRGNLMNDRAEVGASPPDQSRVTYLRCRWVRCSWWLCSRTRSGSSPRDTRRGACTGGWRSGCRARGSTPPLPPPSASEPDQRCPLLPRLSPNPATTGQSRLCLFELGKAPQGGLLANLNARNRTMLTLEASSQTKAKWTFLGTSIILREPAVTHVIVVRKDVTQGREGPNRRIVGTGTDVSCGFW